MKKQLLFCSLALASSLTAFAEVGDVITNLDQLSNDKCYTILPQDNSRGTWVYNTDDPAHLYSTPKMGIEVDKSSAAQHFAFLKSTSGKYYVYSIEGKKFLSYGGGSVVSLSDKLTNANGIASIIPSTGSDQKNYPWVVALNNQQMNLCNAGGLEGSYGIVFYNFSNDVGNCISITEAATFNSAEAMQKIEEFEAAYTEDNVAAAAEANTYLSVPGTAVGCYNTDLWNALNEICGGDGVADIYDANKSGFQEALQNLKDAELVDFVSFSNDKVYKIVNKTLSNGYLYAKEGSEYVFASSKGSSLATTPDSEKWQLHQEDGKYYLYNQGKRAFVKFNSSANKWEFTSEPTVINVEKNTDKGPLSVFWIQDADYTGQYQYMHVNTGNVYDTGVVGWETASDATNYYFAEIPDAEVHQLIGLALKKAKMEAQAVIDSYDSEKANYIGNYSSEAIEALKNAVNDVNATAESVNNALLEAKNSRVKPLAGKYYFILSTMSFDDGGVKTIYENPDGVNVAWHTTEGVASELWQFEQEEGGDGDYYIKSGNTGKYITLNPGAATGTIQTASSTPFRFTEQGNDNVTFGLQAWNEANSDKGTLVLQTGNSWGAVAGAGNESGNYIGTYNEFGANRPTQWNIIEADHVNVAIGETGYATAYFPFAVTIPAGVTAYTVAAAADGVATLSKLSGTIPANTGVVLSGTANTPCTFEFAADAAAVDGNMLKGMTIATAVPAETKAYILANGSKGVGFYLLSQDDRTIAANKAYLIVDDAAAPSAFSLKLDGGLTGIEGVENVAGKAPAYDLQGRRLPQVPTKGLYIQNGKKVIK